MKKSILIICLVLYSSVSTQDYCSLCAGHIGCNHNGNLSPSCPAGTELFRLNQAQINTLLREHNNYRNIIASGSNPRFTRASSMNALSWDFELAFLAELNVMQCEMRHDACRSTLQFPFAGQNLYMHGTSGIFGDLNDQLRGSVALWYNEHNDASQNDIDNCCGGVNFSRIGHFLQLVQDRATRIGCGAIRYATHQWNTTLVACNYSWGNILNQPVYRTGPLNCGASGVHASFNNLCNS